MQKIFLIVPLLVATLPMSTHAEDGKDGGCLSPENEIVDLIRLIGNRDLKLRMSATNNLIKIGEPAIPHVKEATNSNDKMVKDQANLILQSMSAGKVIQFSDGLFEQYPQLYVDWGTADTKKRYEILCNITRLNEKDTPVYNLAESDVGAMIGGIISGAGKNLTDVPRQEICHISAGNSYYYGGADVTRWPYKVPSAASHLLKLLEGGDTHTRRNVMIALGEIGAKEGIPVAKSQMTDEEDDNRAVAIEMLGKLNAREAIPDILTALKNKDEDRKVRRSAAGVLGKFDVKEAIPDIKELLNQANGQYPDARTRGLTGMVLIEFGRKDEVPAEAIEDIKTFVRDYPWEIFRVNSWKREYVLRAKSALQRIGGYVEVINEIKEKFKSPESDRTAVSVALVDLGEKDAVPKEVIEGMKTSLRSGWRRRNMVAKALLELGVSEEEIEKLRRNE